MVKTSITKLMKRSLMLFTAAFMVGASAASASTFDSVDSLKANLEQRITNSNLDENIKKGLLERLEEGENPIIVDNDYTNLFYQALRSGR